MYEESNKVELKEELIDEVKNEINAFLNTSGGTVYIGVSDEGMIHPFKNKEQKDLMDNKVSSWIQEAYFPHPSNLIKHYFNKDNILVIEVKEGNEKPYYLKEKGPKPSGVYKRVGRTTRKASEYEILNMIMDSKNYSYEEDISEQQDLTFKYFFQICDDNKISHEKRSLKSLRLISKDNKYTNLAFLVSDQCNVEAKFAKYDSNLNFIDKKNHSGSLIKILNDVIEHANNYNITSAVIDGKTFKRIEQQSYPGASLREAILNAFCHANYFLRSNIKIEFYDNEVKITNPGSIYKATLDEIMSGIQTYRNPGLVKILDKLNYIENYGTGIPRMLEAYENFSTKPEFLPTDNFFVVKLPNTNYYDPLNDPLNDPISDPININLKDWELELLNIIKNNPGLNSNKLKTMISKEYPDITIDKIKNSLKRNLSSFCEFKGSRKNGGYYIK